VIWLSWVTAWTVWLTARIVCQHVANCSSVTLCCGIWVAGSAIQLPWLLCYGSSLRCNCDIPRWDESVVTSASKTELSDSEVHHFTVGSRHKQRLCQQDESTCCRHYLRTKPYQVISLQNFRVCMLYQFRSSVHFYVTC